MPEAILLLASASPRRRELFRLLNIPFETLATDIDETPRPGEAAPDLVIRLSRDKAAAARAARPDALIVACDTSVELDGELLGKPVDAAEARAMLRRLRGREHRVWGGTVISFPARDAYPGEEQALVVKTRVWMRDYAEAEVEAYVATGDPLDKAAAYAVQHPAFQPVARWEGCYANVMGLALCHLYNALKESYALPEPCLECQAHPDRDCTVARLVAAGTVVGT